MLHSEGASSSGLGPPPSSSSSIPRLRPWLQLSTFPSFSLRQMNEEEEETHKIACCEAGVWAQVEEHMAAAVEETQIKEEHSVALGGPSPGAWVRRVCTSWLNRHKLYCSREGCPTRREMMQKWEPGATSAQSVAIIGSRTASLSMGALPLQ